MTVKEFYEYGCESDNEDSGLRKSCVDDQYITATGVFYSFMTHGLGRVLGLASGISVTVTYIVFEVARVRIFDFFATSDYLTRPARMSSINCN